MDVICPSSLPEMRIWSILFIKSDSKWCIHLRRSLFLYLNCMIHFDLAVLTFSLLLFTNCCHRRAIFVFLSTLVVMTFVFHKCILLSVGHHKS